MTFKEYSLQDGNTLEATQTMLESRACLDFPLNDQEILLRQLHKTAGDYVADYEKTSHPVRSPACLEPASPTARRRPVTDGANPDGRPSRPPSPTSSRSPSWSLETEAERYAKRLSSTMDELQSFYDAAFPRLEDALDYLDGFDLTRSPRRESDCSGSPTRWSTPPSRSRCGANRGCRTAVRPAWRWSSNRLSERSGPRVPAPPDTRLGRRRRAADRRAPPVPTARRPTLEAREDRLWGLIRLGYASRR